MNGYKPSETLTTRITGSTKVRSESECSDSGNGSSNGNGNGNGLVQKGKAESERGSINDRFYELLALVTWVFLLLVYLNGIHKITFGLIFFAPLLVVQSAILLHLVEMFAT